MSTNQPPFMATAVFCEDLRAEPTGAISMIGVFPDNVGVAQMPAMFRKLTIHVRTVLPVPVKIKSHVVELHLPAMKEAAASNALDDATLARLAQANPKDGAIVTLVSSIQAQNVGVAEYGRARIDVIVDGQRATAAILNFIAPPGA